MKKLFCLAFLIITFHSFEAQDRNFGLGVIIGNPTGISGKLWVNEVNAVDFGLGYSFFGKNDFLSLHADYLYHDNELIKTEYTTPVYYGFGVRIRLHDKERGSFGIRGAAGILIYLDKIPVDVFFELAPVFKLLPETALNLDFGLGARYYFD